MPFDDHLLLREYYRRLLLPRGPNFRGAMFPKQRLFADDQAKRKSALCTRRAGKSLGIGLLLYEAASATSDVMVPYISLTRKSAKTIMWPVMRKIKKMLNIEHAELLEGSLTVRLGNTEIPLWGADQENFAERIRGGAYPLVAIDESQSFRDHLAYLIDDVIDPTLLDFDGSLLLAGTPGPVRSGYFYEVTELGRHGFSNHRWSVYENPHMPNAREWVEKRLKAKNQTWENPTVRREWLGEWVEDPDATVYKFKRDKNEFRDLPENKREWRHVIGIDYGWNDQTAFSVIAYNANQPYIFVKHVEGHGQMIPSETAARLKQLIEKYEPIKIVADTGGLGKSITEEMRRRYHLPIEPAQKTEKQTWIRLVNGDMVDGNFKVHESLEELKDQYLKLTKDSDGEEDPNLPNDLCDAVLYAYRAVKAYLFTVDEPEPKTEEERWAREEKRLLDEDEEAEAKSRSGEWWES